MKIGICCEFYERWKDQRYRKMREFGFTHVDYGMANTELRFYSCSDAELEIMMLHEKALMEEAGIGISQVHGPWRWPAQDSTREEREERMEKMKRSIRATALLGCKNWVIHPLMPCGPEEKDTADAQTTWDLNRSFMSELLETAKAHDVTICLENMPLPEFSMGSPMEVLSFVKMMNDDHFKICLDTGHASVYEELSPADAVRLLGDEIRVLHVHDNRGKGDLHLLPYFGFIDWNDFGRALKEIGFQGVFSYEAFLFPGLPDEYLEEFSRILVRIAREILSDDGSMESCEILGC